jgi:hypothetical protein
MVIAALVLILLAGCSGGDSGSDGSGDRGGSEGDGDTTTTQPAGSDVAALQPYIEQLLAAWDESMTAILADPGPVAEDADHRLRRELAESFTDDSPYVEDLGALLTTGYVDQDVGIRPAPNGLAQETTLVEFTGQPSDDQVSFVFCTYNAGVGYSLSTGEERPPSVGVTQGAGEAQRVEGVWLLHRLRQLGNETQPAGTPNPCPDLVVADGDG